MRKILIGLINFYQTYLSFDRGVLAIFAPGGACKYSPTCSEYTKQSVSEYGVLKGLKLGIKRIISCNPLTNSDCGINDSAERSQKP